MEPESDGRITEHLPPAARGTLVLADAVLGRSPSAAVVLRSIVGYDEGIKVETEFLLREPGMARRPLRDALDPGHPDPVISFGAGTAGEFHPLTWNVVDGPVIVSTLSAHEAHSRLTVRTWIEPVPVELVVGVRWLSQAIRSTYLRIDCRRAEGRWSAPLWPDGPPPSPGAAG